MKNSIRIEITVSLFTVIWSLWGCARPIHPDSMLIKEVQAAPRELIISCDPPLESYYVVDKMKVARRDGVVSVRFFKHNIYVAGNGVVREPVRIPIAEGDRSVVFTDGTADREIWNASKGVLEFKAGYYYPPPVPPMPENPVPLRDQPH